MKLGCTTATFGGKLPEKLAAIAAAGFCATEFWPRDLYEHAEGPEAAIDCLKTTGLKVSAYQALRNFEGSKPAQMPLKLKIANQLLDQMDLIEAETLVLCSNTSPDAAANPEIQAADLRRLGDIAHKAGKRIAYEPLCWGHCVNSYQSAWKLLRQADHPAVGLLLDAFHIFARGDSLDQIREIPGDRIFLVELADIPRTNLGLIELSRGHRFFPGDGVAPVREFIDQVRATGYDGIYSLEIFNAFHAARPPLEVAHRAMSSLRSLFD